MKKILALTLIIVMTFLMIGCGPKTDKEVKASDTQVKENVVAEEIAKETKEETTEEVAKETKEETTEEVAEETKEEATEEVVKETKEVATEEVAKETKEEATEEVAKETKEEATEEVAKETKEEVTEKVAKETKEETTEEAAEETKEEVTEEVAKETKEEVTEEAAKETKEETTEEVAEETKEEVAEEISAEPVYEYNPIDISKLEDAKRPIVTITFQGDEKIVLKLVPEVAPNTVNSFITSINDGFYDGLIFHRIIKDFMIQGGDPEGTGSGGPGFTINDEFFVIDDLTVTYLSHAKGIISMAKTQAANSAGSQFFITHGDSQFLDGGYASFGFVTEGLDVVDQFGLVETNENDKPLEDVVIKTITVELNGYELEEPIRN